MNNTIKVVIGIVCCFIALISKVVMCFLKRKEITNELPIFLIAITTIFDVINLMLFFNLLEVL